MTLRFQLPPFRFAGWGGCQGGLCPPEDLGQEAFGSVVPSFTPRSLWATRAVTVTHATRTFDATPARTGARAEQSGTRRTSTRGSGRSRHAGGRRKGQWCYFLASNPLRRNSPCRQYLQFQEKWMTQMTQTSSVRWKKCVLCSFSELVT